MSATLSVVIPVYNEEAGLASLYARLYPELDKLGRQYEVIFVDDGSSDRSVALLREQFQRRSDTTRVVVLARNAGQHMAILAGFAQSRGDYVITLDADLQNRRHHVARPLAHLLIDAAHILPNNAETNQQHPDQEERNAEQGKHALRFRTDYEAANRKPNDSGERQERERGTGHGKELQRRHREPGHEVEVEPDETVERIL